MKLFAVICLSLCLSVCPIMRPPTHAAASLLLWARRAADNDQLLHGRPALSSSYTAARRAAANAGSATLSADVVRLVLTPVSVLKIRVRLCFKISLMLATCPFRLSDHQPFACMSEQFLNGTSAHNRPFQCHLCVHGSCAKFTVPLPVPN